MINEQPSVVSTTEQYIWFDETNDDYYFSDETELLVGPYETMVEALDALEEYAKWLNGDSSK